MKTSRHSYIQVYSNYELESIVTKAIKEGIPPSTIKEKYFKNNSKGFLEFYKKYNELKQYKSYLNNLVTEFKNYNNTLYIYVNNQFKILTQRYLKETEESAKIIERAEIIYKRLNHISKVMDIPKVTDSDRTLETTSNSKIIKEFERQAQIRAEQFKQELNEALNDIYIKTEEYTDEAHRLSKDYKQRKAIVDARIKKLNDYINECDNLTFLSLMNIL